MHTMNINNAMQIVAEELPTNKLERLAIELGLGVNVAEEMLYDYEHSGIREAIYQLQVRWQQKYGREATVVNLANALNRLGLVELTQTICPGIVSPCPVKHNIPVASGETGEIEADAVPIPHGSSEEKKTHQENTRKSSIHEEPVMIPGDLQSAMNVVESMIHPGKLRKLAESLGLSKEAAEDIEYDYKKRGGRLQLLKLMQCWKERKGNDATIEALAIALINIEYTEIAQKIYSEIIQNTQQQHVADVSGIHEHPSNARHRIINAEVPTGMCQNIQQQQHTHHALKLNVPSESSTNAQINIRTAETTEAPQIVQATNIGNKAHIRQELPPADLNSLETVKQWLIIFQNWIANWIPLNRICWLLLATFIIVLACFGWSGIHRLLVGFFRCIVDLENLGYILGKLFVL